VSLPRLADTRAAASLVQVSPSTLHTWAARGLLTKHGHDERGRTLYDLEEVQAVADLRRERTRSGNL
jgi:DNA-binding transcriptional MerR regulator